MSLSHRHLWTLGLAVSGLACIGRVPTPVTPAAPAVEQRIRPTLGLALGGGGARGFAHLGVLRLLEQEKIAIDLVTGTSVGALIGALYADSGHVLEAELLSFEIAEDELFDYGVFSWLAGGLAEGAGLERFLREHLKHPTFEELPVRFSAVATDLASGETVVFESGSVAEGVRASAAIPGVFAPVAIDGRLYVDGGISDPVPVDVARARGADVVVAVAIPQALPPEIPGNPIAVARRAIAILSASVQELRAREADVVIRPDVGDLAFDDFTQRRRAIVAGEEAARAALPAIRAALAAREREMNAPAHSED